MRLLVPLVAAPLFAAVPAAAQTQILIATGDVFPGLGPVVEIEHVAVDDAGNWAAGVRFDQLGGPLPTGVALVHNGAVVLASPAPLPGVTGAPPLFSILSLDLDPAGDPVWIANAVSNAALYRGTTLLAQVGETIVAPGVTPGTTYSGFYDARSGAVGETYLHAIANDSAIVGLQDNLLLRLDEQPGGGVVTTDLVKRGDVLPQQVAAVQSLSEFRDGLAPNTVGGYAFVPTMQDSTTAVYVTGAPVAQTGKQAPLFGKTWTSFLRCAVALNDAGDYALTGRISGDAALAEVVVWNGLVVARLGDLLPAVAPFALDDLFVQSGDFAPVRLDSDGRIYWFGSWDDPDAGRDDGLFLDQELLVREGATAVGGLVLTNLRPNGPSFPGAAVRPVFDVGPAGDQVALRAQLADGRIAAVRLRPGGDVVTVPGCAGNAGTLSIGGAPTPSGVTLVLNVGNAQAAGAVAVVALTTSLVPGAPPCGQVLPGVGELLVDFGPASLIAIVPGLFPAQLPAGGTITLGPLVPDDPALVGFVFHAQGVWVDPTPGAAELFRATNALSIELGL